MLVLLLYIYRYICTCIFRRNLSGIRTGYNTVLGVVLVRKRLFIFAAATCFALSAFATPAFAGEPNLTDGPTIGSEASVQSDGNSNGNPDGNSDGNPDGNSDGNVKEDALPGGSNDALPNGENNNSERQTNPSVAAPVVAKIGETDIRRCKPRLPMHVMAPQAAMLPLPLRCKAIWS